MRTERPKWNHNIHYYDAVLEAAPSNARTALDVGTGDGLLAVRLAQTIPEVTAIDADADVLARAAGATSVPVGWVTGDVLTSDLPEEHYDLVAAVATVHHFADLGRGLRRLAQLTSPGGALVVIGCARSSSTSDFVYDLAGVVQHQVLSRTRGFWQHSAPVQMNFPHTFAETKQIAAEHLPGAIWRRLPLWRYSLVWHRL